MSLREMLNICDKECVQVIIWFVEDEDDEEDNMLIFEEYEEEYYQEFLDYQIGEIQPYSANKIRVFVDVPQRRREYENY